MHKSKPFRVRRDKDKKRGGDAMWEGSGLSRLPVRVLFVFLSDKSIWDLDGFRCACRNQLQPGVLPHSLMFH